MKTTLVIFLSLTALLGASACDPRLESLDDQVRVITPCEPPTRHNLNLPPKTRPPTGTKAFVGKNKKGNHYGQILFGRYSHVDISF
ncbi:hypothetical protein KJ865_08590, partial [Myxococcota bacterium]|nr:hypothetical protein [Myxococcota bacterium]